MGLFLGFLSCSIGLLLLFLCQYQTVLMTVALLYNLKSGRLITPALFFLKMTLVSQGLLCFHMNCEIFCSSFVKNAIGNLIEPSNRLGRQPWALSLPDKELCLREALAVCTPPAPEPSAKRPGS